MRPAVPRYILRHRRTHLISRSISCTSSHPTDHRASSKLFQDAAREEAAPQPTPKTPPALRESENWTGDERVEDAVLRMLVDKYKPLRTGNVRTAEEKLRQAPPRVSSSLVGGVQAQEDDFQSSTSPSTQIGTSTSTQTSPYDPNAPLIPPVEGHRPWHTTFKVPSHATSNIKYGAIPSPPRRAASPASDLDDKARRRERESVKRTQAAGRLTRAREETLDYRLGIREGKVKHAHAHAGVGARPNPASVKGWAGLVEERIERARQEGRFRVMRGRGKPIERQTEERNPFIGREEFLMNRIVQRQGAAPPWVEVQGELDSALSAFRAVLRDSWTRRAIRMLTTHPPALLSLQLLTLADVRAHRDPEWEKRERAYQDAALGELNALVRKYNGLAPYAVRRAYYVLAIELERVYEECGGVVLEGVRRRVEGGDMGGGRGYVEEDEEGGSGGGEGEGGLLRIRDVVMSWFRRR